MDKQTAQRIVHKALPVLKAALYLQDWEIHIEYGHIECHDEPNVTFGNCKADPKYRKAVIKINHEKAYSERQLLDTLFHELLHVVVSETETLRRLILQFVHDEAENAVSETHSYVVERIIGNLERVFLCGLGLTPGKIVAKELRKQAPRKRGRRGQGRRP